MADTIKSEILKGGLEESVLSMQEKIEETFRAHLKDAKKTYTEKFEQLKKDAEENPEKYKVQLLDEKALNEIDPNSKSIFKAQLSDAYNNQMLGIGASEDVMAQYDMYDYASNLYNWNLWISLYMTSWVFRNIIDQQTADIVGHGIKISIRAKEKRLVTRLSREANTLVRKEEDLNEVSMDDIDEIYEILEQALPDLNTLVSWGKLFGGSAALVMDSGLDPNEYYKPLTEIKGEIKLFVSDRWNYLSTSNEKVSNILSDDFKTPKYYNFHLPGGDVVVAHHTRVLQFRNKLGPQLIQQMLMDWGIPDGVHLFHELNRNEKIKNIIISLMNKWNLEILKLQNMRQYLQGNLSPEAEAELDEKIEVINRYRAINSLIFLDKDDEYIREDGSSLTGMAELLRLEQTEVAGASRMPRVLIYGDQEKGFADADYKNSLALYDQRIQGEKNGEYRRVIKKFLNIIKIKLNLPESATIKFKFNSIIEPTFDDKIEASNNLMNVYKGLLADGFYTKKMVAKELKQYEDKIVFGQEMTDEVIDGYEDDAPQPQTERPNNYEDDFESNALPNGEPGFEEDIPQPESLEFEENTEQDDIFSDLDANFEGGV